MPVLTDKLEIKINGNSYTDYEFMDVSLVQDLLKPNELKFSMRKKSLLKNKDDIALTLSDKLLNAKIECKITTERRDENESIKNETLTFNGIIFHVSIQRETMGHRTLFHITAYSSDYLLNDHPHCYSYENKTLSDIVFDTLKDYSSEISLDLNPMMSESIPYVVQYNETSYQFISRLAQRYGEFFYYENGKMVFGKMNKRDPVYLYPDVDILGYHYELDMVHSNFAHCHHHYLDYKNSFENAVDHDEQTDRLNEYAYAHSKSAFAKSTLQHLRGSVPENNPVDPIQTSVKAQNMGAKSQMMLCFATTNRADLRLGSKIVIREFADKDGGGMEIENHDELVIFQITHRLNINGHYENEITAMTGTGDSPPYANVDLYPVTESQRAIVRDNKDPEKLGRVRVQFAWQELWSEDMLTPWIRMAQPHGGNNKGHYFIPEIDEEVMVGFENGNAEKPFVVGTLYHGTQRPGNNWPNDSNTIKAIRTRNGHTVEIHDEGEGGFIRIYDNEKENYILTYSTDEKLIKLESTGNIELYAKNDIIMDAGNNIEMKAGVDFHREAGENITEKAGENITVDASKNITETAGKDMKISVADNHTVEMGKDYDISVGKNMDVAVSKKYSVEATDMLQDANRKVQMYAGASWEQKADGNMKIDGGGKMDIAGDLIKIS